MLIRVFLVKNKEILFRTWPYFRQIDVFLFSVNIVLCIKGIQSFLYPHTIHTRRMARTIVYPATGCDWFRDSDHRWVDCGLFWASPSSKGGCSWRPACVRKCLSLQNELVGTMRAVARMLARTTNTADRVRVLQSYMKGKGKVSESVQAYPTDYTL